MLTQFQISQIVWHDLLTTDIPAALNFYAELLGWDYQIEHASNFSWTSGEADYPLIMAQGTAHGGMINLGSDHPTGWLGYVGVQDVDIVVQKAVRLGAEVYRAPFDVPGVGRNAVIHDPKGATIGLTTPTHAFPPPQGLFLWDMLITADIESAKRFYTELLAWQVQDGETDLRGEHVLFRTAENPHIVGTALRSPIASGPAVWVPMLATADVAATFARARLLGASRAIQTADSDPNAVSDVLLTDPTGALFGLSPTVAHP